MSLCGVFPDIHLPPGSVWLYATMKHVALIFQRRHHWLGQLLTELSTYLFSDSSGRVYIRDFSI